jgi:hypothetical protein
MKPVLFIFNAVGTSHPRLEKFAWRNCNSKTATLTERVNWAQMSVSISSATVVGDIPCPF